MALKRKLFRSTDTPGQEPQRPEYMDFEPSAPNQPENLHWDRQKPHTTGGGERFPAKKPGRLGKGLKSEDILIRDFTDAVKKGDLPGFFVSHPELARMGWRQINAEHQRRFRIGQSPDEAATRREKDAERARVRRQQETPDEAAMRREKDAERKRLRRALGQLTG